MYAACTNGLVLKMHKIGCMSIIYYDEQTSRGLYYIHTTLTVYIFTGVDLHLKTFDHTEKSLGHKNHIKITIPLSNVTGKSSGYIKKHSNKNHAVTSIKKISMFAFEVAKIILYWQKDCFRVLLHN